MTRTKLQLPDDFFETVKELLSTLPRTAPSYGAVIAEVKAAEGFTTQTCWIADVLRGVGV